MMRWGFSAESCSHPMPHFSSAPGRKFSITMSVVRARLRTISWPSGARKWTDGFLVARLHVPPERSALVHLAPLAQLVAAVRRLDLDHLGAKFPEHARADRPSDERTEFDDLDALKCLRSGHGVTGPESIQDR